MPQEEGWNRVDGRVRFKPLLIIQMKLLDFWKVFQFSQIQITLHLLITLGSAKPQIVIEEPTKESDSLFSHEEEEWIGIHH